MEANTCGSISSKAALIMDFSTSKLSIVGQKNFFVSLSREVSPPRLTSFKISLTVVSVETGFGSKKKSGIFFRMGIVVVMLLPVTSCSRMVSFFKNRGTFSHRWKGKAIPMLGRPLSVCYSCRRIVAKLVRNVEAVLEKTGRATHEEIIAGFAISRACRVPRCRPTGTRRRR